MDDRLQEAQLLIGLLEYDRADELLRGVLRDADAGGDDATASLVLEALGTIATRLGREGLPATCWSTRSRGAACPIRPSARSSTSTWRAIHSGLGEADAAIACCRPHWRGSDDDGDPRCAPTSASRCRSPARTPATTLGRA